MQSLSSPHSFASPLPGGMPAVFSKPPEPPPPLGEPPPPEAVPPLLVPALDTGAPAEPALGMAGVPAIPPVPPFPPLPAIMVSAGSSKTATSGPSQAIASSDAPNANAPQGSRLMARALLWKSAAHPPP
jgi:hypothetical protein